MTFFQWTRRPPSSPNCLFSHCCTFCRLHLLYTSFTSLLHLCNISEPLRASVCVREEKNKLWSVCVSVVLSWSKGKLKLLWSAPLKIAKWSNNVLILRDRMWKVSWGCHRCHHTKKKLYWEVQCGQKSINVHDWADNNLQQESMLARIQAKEKAVQTFDM